MSRIGAQTVADRPMRVSLAVAGPLLAGLAGLVVPALPAGVLTVTTAVWLLLTVLGLGQLVGIVRKSQR